MKKEKLIRFWHGMSEESWKQTKEQGFLLHARATKESPNMSPCTYLAVNRAEAEQYGEVVVEVIYDPLKNSDMNNYQKDAWQLRVYEKIPIKNVRLPNDGAILCGGSMEM